tara:strand:+ start:509 stop:805 length:297 start_codon:yes stop_codon:yes gene_type:complete
MFEVSVDVPRDKPLVGVRTTEKRGFTPEELAEQCTQKIISVSEQTHPAIQDQAKAFASHIEKIVTLYMKQAISSDRTSVYNAIKDAGHPNLAELIRRL